VVPAAFAGWILWAGWPVFGALNFDVGMPVKWVALLTCAAISAGSVYAVSRLRPTLRRLATDGWSAPAATSGHTASSGPATPTTMGALSAVRVEGTHSSF